MNRALLLTAALAMSSTVHAQRFDVQQLRPATTHRTSTIGLMHAQSLPQDAFEAGVFLDWADSPLVLRGEDGGRFGEIVSQQLTGHVVGGFGLFGAGEIGIDVPFVLHQHGDLIPLLPNLDSNASGAGFGVGDVRVIGKLTAFDTQNDREPGGLALAVYLQAQLPTGERHYFQGGELRFTPGVAFDYVGTRGHRFTMNLGYTFRPATSLLDELEVDDTIDFGAALTLAFTEWMRGIVEVRGSVSVLAQDVGVEETPLEATLGVKMGNESASLMVAGGIGLTEGFGTPDYRLMLSASFLGSSETPHYDFDEDHIFDDVDQCPHEAEDFDGFEDDDGCPEREGSSAVEAPSVDAPVVETPTTRSHQPRTTRSVQPRETRTRTRGLGGGLGLL